MFLTSITIPDMMNICEIFPQMCHDYIHYKDITTDGLGFFN